MEPQPNQYPQPDLTERKSPENAPLIWQEMGINARQGRKMDVPKFFRDLHDLDLTGELNNQPAWQQTLLAAGQDILLWSRVYEAAEDSVARYERALQNQLLPQSEREQLRQDIMNNLKIAHLLGLDRNSQNADYQQDVEQIRIWQQDPRFQSLADIAVSAIPVAPTVAEQSAPQSAPQSVPQAEPETPTANPDVMESTEITPDQLLSLIQQTEADVLNSFGLTERVEALNGIMAGDFTYGQVAGSPTPDHLVDEVNLIIAQIKQRQANGQSDRLHEIDSLAHLLPRDRQLSDLESEGAANTLIALARTAYQQIAQLVVERNKHQSIQRMHNSKDMIDRWLVDRAIDAVKPTFLSNLSQATQQRFKEDRERLYDLISLAHETSRNAGYVLSDAIVNHIIEQIPNLDREKILAVPKQTDNNPFLSINDITGNLLTTQAQRTREAQQQEYAAIQVPEPPAATPGTTESPAIIVDYSNPESLRNLEKHESELYDRIMKIGQVTLTVNNAGRKLTNWHKAEASATITAKNNREVMTQLEEQTVLLQEGNEPFLNKPRAAYLDQLVEHGVFERFSIQPMTREIKAKQTQQFGTKTEYTWWGGKKQIPNYREVDVIIGNPPLMAQEIFGADEPNEPLVSIAYNTSELGGTGTARPRIFREFNELVQGPNRGRLGATAGFGIAVPLSVAQEFVSLLRLDPALGRKYMDSFVENCGDQDFIDIDYFGRSDIPGSGFARPPYEDWDRWTRRKGELPGIEIKDFISNPETEKVRQETTFNPNDVINFTRQDVDDSYVGVPTTVAR